MTPYNTQLAQISQWHIDREYYVRQVERIEKKLRVINERIEELQITNE